MRAPNMGCVMCDVHRSLFDVPRESARTSAAHSTRLRPRPRPHPHPHRRPRAAVVPSCVRRVGTTRNHHHLLLPLRCVIVTSSLLPNAITCARWAPILAKRSLFLSYSLSPPPLSLLLGLMPSSSFASRWFYAREASI